MHEHPIDALVIENDVVLSMVNVENVICFE